MEKDDEQKGSGNAEPISVDYRDKDAKRHSQQQVFENLKWLTSREAVVYLRLPSAGALRNLVYRRKLPTSRLGRRLRFNREQLDRILESSQTKVRRIS
ncbi:MAG: helix-turn-helix domain-containing protein [Bdellovibrionota bacterium]